MIGAASRRRPASAFVLGVLSHFALDAAPHWGKWERHFSFMQVAVPDGLARLAVMGAMTAVAPRGARLALAGMAGAALPDLDKPVIFFGRSPWPQPVNRFTWKSSSTRRTATYSRLRWPRRRYSPPPRSGSCAPAAGPVPDVMVYLPP